jgi:parallel beta-helix repeat protein
MKEAGLYRMQERRRLAAHPQHKEKTMELRPAVRVALVVSFLAAAAIPIHAANNEINKCQTIDVSGSYVLNQNIEPNTRAGGDCLTINVDFVTIDLAGYSIIGHNSGFGVAINSARRGVTIRGGTIRNFSTGINLSLSVSRAITIENMHMIDNTFFGIASRAVSIIRNNVCTGNQQGILAGARAVVTGNNSSDNSGIGITVGSGSTVIGNVTSFNGDHGLQVDNQGTVQNNTAYNNGGTGISVGNNSAVIGNTASANAIDLSIDPSCTRANNRPAP